MEGIQRCFLWSFGSFELRNWSLIGTVGASALGILVPDFDSETDDLLGSSSTRDEEKVSQL